MIKKIREFVENASHDAPALEGSTTEYDLECYYRTRLDEACDIILALADVIEGLAECTNVPIVTLEARVNETLGEEKSCKGIN